MAELENQERGAKPDKSNGSSRFRGLVRRVLFVVLLVLVVIGIGVAGFALRVRLSEAVERTHGLEADLDDLQDRLDKMESELEQTQEDLVAQRKQATYSMSLLRAQNQTVKAQVSLLGDDIGLARQELDAVVASLDEAKEVAGDEDASVESIEALQDRISQVQSDLANDDTFAAQQTLEIVWRDLDDILDEQLSQLAR